LKVGLGVSLGSSAASSSGGIVYDPVPGPLDHVENGTGLSSITVLYELATPVAMLGVAFRYQGALTSVSATHGVDTLTLVSLAKDDVAGIGSAIFYGNGLTIEPANLVVTPSGATIGPAVLRIDDSFALTEVQSDWSQSQTGSGLKNNSPQLVSSGIGGDGWFVYSLATVSAEARPHALSWGAGVIDQLYTGVASTGTLLDAPVFTSGPGWSQDAEWWVHAGADGYLIGSDMAPYISAPYEYGLEVDIASGGRMLVQLVTPSGSYTNETIYGPFAGTLKYFASQTITGKSWRIFGSGSVRFRNLKYATGGLYVLGQFARSRDQVPNGAAIQFYFPVDTKFAGCAAEVNQA